jgi:hypothetical protein
MSVRDERFEALLGAAAPLVVAAFDALPDAIGVVWPASMRRARWSTSRSATRTRVASG